MDKNALRQLKIKTSTLKRYFIVFTFISLKKPKGLQLLQQRAEVAGNQARAVERIGRRDSH